MRAGWPGIVTSDGTARGRTEERILAAIASGRPDLEVRYLFGGFVVVPRGTPVIGAATLETLWEKVMEGATQGVSVAGEVVRDELGAQAVTSSKNGADVIPDLEIGTPAHAAAWAKSS
jgi:hypothetical protein